MTWEWGAARAGAYTLLYGRVQPRDSAVASQPLFVYVVDSLGFLGAVSSARDSVRGRARRPRERASIRVPSAATMVDVRGDDTLRVELTIEDATATRYADARRGARRDGLSARQLARPYFVQMKGLDAPLRTCRGTSA